MGFGINSNIDALRAYNALATVNASTTKAQLRLATGKRINSVADDTSGYAVGKSLDQKVQLMTSAQRNVGSAQDLLSTAESQLTSVKDLITSIKAKIADSSNPATDNTKISGDIKALATEIANIFSTTKFNDTKLLTSLSSTQFNFQTGADSTDKMSLDYFNNASGSLSGDATLSTSAFTVNSIGTAGYAALTQLATAGTTAISIGSLSAFIATFENTVDESISKVGNYEQRLTIKNDFLTAAIANSSASVSRLFDADVAKEQLNATKGQIMQQVATSMLSQLNAQPQNLLSLFR
ncbi:MAG: flagellin [Ignavibacteriaceae bacterium]